MATFTSSEELTYTIPDDVTLAQFALDEQHPLRPLRPHGCPWLIHDETGQKTGLDEIRAKVFGLANALSIEFGLQEDDVVCIFSPNDVDYPVAIWAVHRLGSIVSAANPSYTAEELEYQLKASRSSAIIAHKDFLPTAYDAAKRAGISPDRVISLGVAANKSTHTYHALDDLIALGCSRPANFVERRLHPGEGRTKLAFLSFSSGTTGRPKAVAIPHIAPIANVIQLSQYAKVNTDPRPFEQQRHRPGDVTLAVLPFFHIYGLVVVMHWMLFSGSSLVVVPKFDYMKFLRSIQKYRVTHLFLVPPQIVLLCKHPATKKFDLSSVRSVMCGAAPLSKELTEQFYRVLPQADIGQAYGMTETCTAVTASPIELKRGVLGSAGRFLPGIRAKVVKEDGTLAKTGEVGELVVTGPSMALRYANNEQATRETFVDGWVKTGDEVYVSEEGDVFVVDRLKEIMKVRGFQVAPAELEGHLLKHAAVDDCCVVGVPDEYSGELPLAFVVLSSSVAKRCNASLQQTAAVKAELAKWVADHKVAYKKLAGGIEFVDVIPKNPSGKLLRRVLREKAKQLRESQAKILPKL